MESQVYGSGEAYDPNMDEDGYESGTEWGIGASMTVEDEGQAGAFPAPDGAYSNSADPRNVA
jgi:hypothetical protein